MSVQGIELPPLNIILLNIFYFYLFILSSTCLSFEKKKKLCQLVKMEISKFKKKKKKKNAKFKCFKIVY